MNHATCLYQKQHAPLIELLALIEPTPDGYTIALSQSERRRYAGHALLATAKESSDTKSTVTFRIDPGSSTFQKQGMTAVEAITDASSAINRLQDLVDLKPVSPHLLGSNWSYPSEADVAIFPYQALHACLDVLERTASPALRFTLVTSEAHVGELHDAGIRELRFQDGNQDYLAMSASQWQRTSATAATTLFEHRLLITKIAGLTLATGIPAKQLIRLVGPNQDGGALLQAFKSLDHTIRNVRNTSSWARLRDFNEEIRNVRLSSEFASPDCHRYFTNNRRPGKTVARQDLSVPTLPAMKPVTIPVCDSSIDTENATMPMLVDETLPPDWNDWPELPIELTPAAFPTPTLSVGGVATERGVNGTADRKPHDGHPPVTRIAAHGNDDNESSTEEEKDDEWEKSAGFVPPPYPPALTEAITARAPAGTEILVPGMLARTGMPDTQGWPVGLDVSATNSFLLPVFHLTPAWYGHALAASMDAAVVHQQRMAQYQTVIFGRSVQLVGMPTIGSNAQIGDNAIIHEQVQLPQRSIVKSGTVLSSCRILDYQLTPPATLILSGDPSGDLTKLRFKPGKLSSLVELGNVRFILDQLTIVPGGVCFLSGAVVSYFDVGHTAMNNCLVRGSLRLQSPILGANISFGPDVEVEANVTIGDRVVFEGSNLVKAGSVIGTGAMITKGANVSGTVAPYSFVTVNQVPARLEIPTVAALGALNATTGNSAGTPRAGVAPQVAAQPQNAKPVKVLDPTDDDKVVTIMDLAARAPRASLPQAARPDQPDATASQHPVLQPLAVGNSNHLAPTLSLWNLSARPLPSHQQLAFPVPFPVPPPPPVPAPPPVPLPHFQGGISPSMQGDPFRTMAGYGLVHTVPPPALLQPLLQQESIHGRRPPEQAHAIPGNVPGMSEDISPPRLYPQPFSPFTLRKPGF